jgi:ATP-dependent protease HslVU (ClpYQ) peptidase subunit
VTVIAGIAKGGRVWIGSDSVASNDHYMAWNLAEPKAFKSGPFLIGLAGSPRVKQLIKYKLNLKDDPRQSDALEFMCTEFIDRLRAVLGDNGSKASKDNIDGVAGFSWIMVGFRGRLFVIMSDFQVMERRVCYDAIGCGGDYALGSLYESSSSKLSPKQRIEAALKCAETLSAGVRGPFTILESEST